MGAAMAVLGASPLTLKVDRDVFKVWWVELLQFASILAENGWPSWLIRWIALFAKCAAPL
jgi:hypothetical protein